MVGIDLDGGDRRTKVEAVGATFVACDVTNLEQWKAAAKAAHERNDLPEDLRGPLQAESDQFIFSPAFPFGSHVCEVEIDPDTGHVRIDRYTAIDDVGRAINPLILHGQAHGGIVQGVGQALWEHSCYDTESGQLLAGSFMDYAMPRAPMLPSFQTEISETPAPGNKLGVRGGGEGGTTPALAVMVNAVVDALAEFGVPAFLIIVGMYLVIARSVFRVATSAACGGSASAGGAGSVRSLT